MNIRRLGPDDAAIYRAIRREALETHPDTFAQSPDEFDALEDNVLATRLGEIPTVVAFDAGQPVGLMAYQRMTGAVFRHRAYLLNVFVSPRVRGRGIARAMLDNLIGAAKAEGIQQFELVLTVENTGALAFYERTGFRLAGTITNAFRHGNRLVGEHIMVLPLGA